MQKKYFKKSFLDPVVYSREKNGYRFVTRFFEDFPERVACDDSKMEVIYCHKDIIKQHRGLLLDDFHADTYPTQNMITLLKKLYKSAQQTAHYDSPEGENCFYKDRVKRLREYAADMYLKKYIEKKIRYDINGYLVVLRKDLIQKLAAYISKEQNELIFASQGDFHERNICSDGTMVDVGAGGWHSFSGQVATFLWYTLFAADFLAKRYHQSAFHDRKRYLKRVLVPVTQGDDRVNYRISPERSAFITDYRHYMIDPLLDEYEDSAFQPMVHYKIAFRMLTVFDIRSMSEQDRLFCLLIAQYLVDCGEKNSDIFKTIDSFMIHS